MPRSASTLAAIVALLVPAVLAGCGGDPDPRAAACSTLRGDLHVAEDGTATCDVPRTAFATETVHLEADGALDEADRARRRAACETDAGRALRRARAAARARGTRRYASVRWEDPGVCRSARATLPAAEARALEADRLRAEARTALSLGNAGSALALARRADALAPSAASRALVARSRGAAGPPAGGPSTSVVSPNEYLGLSCAAVGHAFRVAPGSDPAHDPDGDGEACEGG